VEERGERIVACPWCDESEEIEMVAEFGPHLIVSQYICRSCRSPFEVIRR
jgi:hypothetical protein